MKLCARQPPKVSNILNTECSVVLNFCRTFTKCLIPIDVIVERFKQTRQLVENTECHRGSILTQPKPFTYAKPKHALTSAVFGFWSALVKKKDR